MQRFDVLGHKRNGHYQHFFHAFVPQLLNRHRQRRLQPFVRPDPALVAQQMNLRPAVVLLRAQLAHQPHRFFDLFRIRIAFFDQAHRQSVRAENQMNPRAIWKLPQNRTDALHQRLNVKRVIVKVINRALGRAP